MKLCNLELSKTLQELDYDGDYYAWIDADNGEVETDTDFLFDWHIPCPRLDDVAYWLRERHGLLVSIGYFAGNRRYWPKVDDMYGYYKSVAHFPRTKASYDDALETAVTEAIEIIKTENK